MPSATPFLCAGAALWDVIGRTDEPLPHGADVPGRIARRPGGVALNIALSLAALGHPVTLLAALGRDGEGDEIAAILAAAGIDTRHLHRHAGATDRYLAIEGAGGDLHAAVADCAGLERAGPALLAPLAEGRLPTPWPGGVVLDGNLSPAVRDGLLTQSSADAPRAIVPASPRKAKALVATGPGVTLYLNRLEAEAVADRAFPDSRAAAADLRQRGVAEVIVTDGPRAATAAGPDGTISLLPPPVARRSLTGAGDAFVAAHLSSRAAGLGPADALRAALAASARHITAEVP